MTMVVTLRTFDSNPDTANRSMPLTVDVSSRMEAEVREQLVSIPPEDWERLFPTSPDHRALIELSEQSGFEGFRLGSIVVSVGKRAVLLLPIFCTEYHLEAALPGAARAVAAQIARMLPLLHPRMLGVGFVEGEWGEVGYDRSLDKQQLAAAWEAALNTLRLYGDKVRASLFSWIEFTSESGAVIPPALLDHYTTSPGLACGIVQGPFASVDDYLARLSKATRKDLRRKEKSCAHIRIERCVKPEPLVDAIYELYLDTVARSSTVFGVHNKEFFARVCDQVPGAEYQLYFDDRGLVAFNLLVVRGKTLVDKYFGRRDERGENIYFLSWLHNIRICAERNLDSYHAGPGSAELKLRLGARLVAREILFRHRYGIVNSFLTLFARATVFAPKADLPRAQLGTWWSAHG